MYSFSSSFYLDKANLVLLHFVLNDPFFSQGDHYHLCFRIITPVTSLALYC